MCALTVARSYNLETKNRSTVLEELERESKDLLRFNFTQTGMLWKYVTVIMMDVEWDSLVFIRKD